MRRKKRTKIKTMPIILLILSCCLIWGFIEPHIIVIKRYSVSRESLPNQFSGFKIGFVSDLHIGKYTKKEVIDKIITKLRKENIDLLILGGDYVYKYHGNINELFQPFTSLTTTNGMYAVLGNHDNREAHEKILKALSNNHFNVIDHKNIQIQRGDSFIELSGVPDYWDIDFTDNHINTMKDFYRILVSHNPDYLVETVKKYNLGLSGHTHGGQITLFGLWAPFLPIVNKNYWKGQYTHDMKDIIISRGIGEVAVPVRFSAVPEISIITLYKRKEIQL